MFQYEVFLKSKAGFYAQYSGSVKVYADDEESAVKAALLKLKRGAFPDRSSESWQVVEVKKLH